MNFEESVEQLESLIEAWQLNEADLNQTDIDALKILLNENTRLLELCMYALIRDTKIYNHELSKVYKEKFIDIIKCNLDDDTYTLRKKIIDVWKEK